MKYLKIKVGDCVEIQDTPNIRRFPAEDHIGKRIIIESVYIHSDNIIINNNIYETNFRSSDLAVIKTANISSFLGKNIFVVEDDILDKEWTRIGKISKESFLGKLEHVKCTEIDESINAIKIENGYWWPAAYVQLSEQEELSPYIKDIMLGDTVIGLPTASERYALTKAGWLGKVTKIETSDGKKVFSAKSSGDDKVFHYLDPTYFTVVSRQGYKSYFMESAPNQTSSSIIISSPPQSQHVKNPLDDTEYYIQKPLILDKRNKKISLLTI